MKKCSKCFEEKSLDAFSRRSGKQSHLYQSWCKPCRSRKNADRNKERYDTDPAFREKLKSYWQSNPEKVARWRRAEYENNREDYLRRAREWRESHRAERRQISRKYKVKRKEWELTGSFTTADWEELLQLAGHRCLACGKVGVTLTQDHIVPLSRGGSNTIDNIQPLCGSCNSSKGTRTINYWEDDSD